MRQKTDFVTVRINDEMKHYFDVLSKIYHVKRSQFIRDAIIEKLRSDVPELRIQNKKSDCPF